MSAASDPDGPGATLSRRSALAALATLFATGCSKLAFLAVNVPATFGDYQRSADLAYGEDPQHRLDVYVPKAGAAARADGAHPLLVFWHGGRWTFGDKADYRFVGAALAGLGCVAVLPNYRHYPQVRREGFMDDAARAARWAVAHAHEYGADPQRLFLMGHSSGAHLAALLTLDTRYLEAAGGALPQAGLIGLSGPYDFLPFTDGDTRDMFGPPADYPASQPINFVRADAPPALLIHGLRDDTVWPKNTRNLATALHARGVPVALKWYATATHADTVGAMSRTVRGRAPTLADIAAFISAPREQARLAPPV
jgi:acetyl esterase/lipase